jgi:hypothetical protein
LIKTKSKLTLIAESDTILYFAGASINVASLFPVCPFRVFHIIVHDASIVGVNFHVAL